MSEIDLKKLENLSKTCTIMIGLCWLGVVLTTIFHYSIPGIICSVVCTGMFGHAIYMDIKNKRWVYNE
jgi:putative effector of murein hydrolase LrgA (UPF0299 family)